MCGWVLLHVLHYCCFSAVPPPLLSMHTLVDCNLRDVIRFTCKNLGNLRLIMYMRDVKIVGSI